MHICVGKLFNSESDITVSLATSDSTGMCGVAYLNN